MALKFKLETLDGLDEALKPLYTPTEDGKFVLQLEDDPAKATMQKLRQELAEKEKALKAAADEKAAKEREAEEAKARASGDFDKLKAQMEARTKEAEAKAEALQNRIREASRERALMDAISQVGGIPKALLPHLKELVEDVAEGDAYKHLVKGDPSKKLTDFISGLKAEMPWGFQATNASGGGANPNAGTPQAKAWKDMTLDERTALYKTNPAQAAALQKGA